MYYRESPKPSNKKKVIVGLSLLAVVGVIGAVLYFSASPSIHPVLQVQYHIEQIEFNSFLKRFGKSYESDAEYQKRFQIYRDNLAYIRAFNSFGKDWKLGVNEFVDLTAEEFKQIYHPSPIPRTPITNLADLSDVEVPDSIDWRSKGAVTGVKNQGQCGSCWSFSTTGSIEGAWAIANHGLVSLSEQQLVDCSGSYGNMGCNGGLMDYAFKYVMANGITSETNYPYKAVQGSCNRTKAKQAVAHISSYSDVARDNADALKAAVSKGPVSVAVEADQSAWQFYSGGIVNSNCGTRLDHGVLVVGYAPDYYIVKNSWGKGWGEQGYIRIGVTNGNGVCGIQMQPSFPIV